jgi:hypothetical protein
MNERKQEFLQTGHFLRAMERCPRQESNLRTRFRKPLLYPLSYGGGCFVQASRDRPSSRPDLGLAGLRRFA